MSTLRLSALTAATVAALLLSGCTGLPDGAADTGDLVTIRYTAEDLATGATLRTDQQVSFDVGSGASGLGLQVERAVRGHVAGDEVEVTVRDDPSLDYGQPVEVDRTLVDIAIVQSAPYGEFKQFVTPTGEPTVGLTFQAYGIYTGRVTNVTQELVTFRIEAEDGQQNQVPAVGAVLESRVGTTHITRILNPVVDATFTIQPAQVGQTTPLGLDPGSYKVLGATDDKLQLARSTSRFTDLLGKDLHVTFTVVAIAPKDRSLPTEGNFGVRGGSPQLKGDPYAALGAEPTAEEPAESHTH